MADSPCWHVRKWHEDERFMTEAKRVMEFGFDETHRIYFGDVLELDT